MSRFWVPVIAASLLIGSQLYERLGMLRASVDTLSIAKTIMRLHEGGSSGHQSELDAAAGRIGDFKLHECRLKGVALYGLSVGYSRLDYSEETVKTLQQVIALGCLKPGDFRIADAFARLGALQATRGDPANAIEYYQRALADLPAGVRGYFAGSVAEQLGILFRTMEQTQDARKYLELATTLDPENYAAYLRLMELAIWQHQYEEAVLWGSRLAAKPFRGSSGALLLGRMYLSRGMLADASTQFRRAVALEPENDATHFWLGLALVALKDWSEAAKELESVSRLNPNRTDHHKLLGEVYLKMGRTDDAAREFARIR